MRRFLGAVPASSLVLRWSPTQGINKRMASVTIDVAAIADVLKRARKALQPGPNKTRGDWRRNEQMLNDIDEAATIVRDNPILAQYVSLSVHEARLILPYLEYDGVT